MATDHIKDVTDIADEACLRTIGHVFDCDSSKIENLRLLTDGMTNTSFLFDIDDSTYVFRNPGLGTEELIDRSQEKHIYELISPLDICDELIFFDGNTGVKISRYYPGSRVTDPKSDADVAEAMVLLKKIHDAGLKPNHRFDIAERIDFYEGLALAQGEHRFADYHQTRAKVNRLLKIREQLGIDEVLCHIDYVNTNVLHLPSGEIRVIDWEYSGAADPLIDIAMYGIYTYYSQEEIDASLRHYCQGEPTRQQTARVYMYVGLGGFLWSLWTEYKQGLGDDFGEYSADMYRYMNDYYHILDNGGYLDDLERGN
ncbi:MAG: phosphotransferase family protein [Propionibacteriaceae bacterium]|nr:phosphotransferase family protein [Propionibacteriaceae bacterium]